MQLDALPEALANEDVVLAPAAGGPVAIGVAPRGGGLAPVQKGCAVAHSQHAGQHPVVRFAFQEVEVSHGHQRLGSRLSHEHGQRS